MTIQVELGLQLELLDGICSLYDAGRTGHARDIATRLGVILDTLEAKDARSFVLGTRLRLLSNAGPILPHHTTMGYHPLSVLSVSGTFGGPAEAAFTPLFRHPESIYTTHFLKLGAWRSEIILMAATTQRLSRGALLTQMRNKDGGAHPTTSRSSAYDVLSSVEGIGLRASGPAGFVPYDPPAHFATMRHMAHEVRQSLSAAGL